MTRQPQRKAAMMRRAPHPADQSFLSDLLKARFPQRRIGALPPRLSSMRQSAHARCVLTAQAGEYLSHITRGKTYELGEAERPAGAHARASRVPAMAASATSVRRRLWLRA